MCIVVCVQIQFLLQVNPMCIVCTGPVLAEPKLCVYCVCSDAVPTTGAEVPGAPGGWPSPGGPALSAARAHPAQVQHGAHPRAVHVSTRTGRCGPISRAQVSPGEGREFECRSSQTNDLPN